MLIPNLPMVRPLIPSWNKGRIISQKRALASKHVRAIWVLLELAKRFRDLALFYLAIDSKLRGCDFVLMKVSDVFAAGFVKERTSFDVWLKQTEMCSWQYLWPS